MRYIQLSLFSYNMVSIYTITSGLHNEESVARLSDEFLNGIFPDGEYAFKGADFQDFGTGDLDLIYVRTGGTEGLFRQLMLELVQKSESPFYLLASDKSNSLAASLEILSYLRQQGLQGEILHGPKVRDFVLDNE